MRLYPDFLPVISGEPVVGDFEVARIDAERGEGVIAQRRFSAGEPLFRMNGIPKRVITQHTLQMGPGRHLHDPWVAGKVLHSCEPNSRLDVKTRRFYAVRDIAPGDLLTMDYDETEDVLFRSFECCCGAPSCRGLIAGRNVPTTLVPLVAVEDAAALAAAE